MLKLPPAQSFEDLIVWQKSHRLTLFVYQVTAAFPKTELYGLVSQMRRAAVSVPANIAEGFKRRKNPDKARCMNIAGFLGRSAVLLPPGTRPRVFERDRT